MNESTPGRLLPWALVTPALAWTLVFFGLQSIAAGMAARCRALGRLVNVEDVKPLCDFHTPSQVRRGDLLLSISTGGA